MSEQVQMDVLAYGSRMIHWAPLGKLLFTFSLLILALVSDNIFVPIITFCIGLGLMAYSTNFRLPSIIGLAILEAILIMTIGCGMVSILGDPSEPAVLLSGTSELLWIDIHITANSFNHAWLIMFRAVAGVTLMLSFASSTPIPHIAYALSQLKIPKEVIEIVVLVYRYAFLLLERAEVMWNAAKCRLGFNGARRSMSTTAGILVNVFITSLEIAERSQPALESRNYVGSFPIYRMPNKVGLYWAMVTAMVCTALYIFGYFAPSPNMAAIILGAV
ncbi:MAG: energy-coupling factor transporter transmembrane protein EcfT [Candidatus Methanomethylophilaceae archaeon]|nr:cobalt/nickel transport system permease protein cbiQ [Candidatus Methanomethylophilaceae archaeon]